MRTVGKLSLVAACLLFPGWLPRTSGEPQKQVGLLTAIRVTVADLERSVAFYRNTLGMQLAARPQGRALLVASYYQVYIDLQEDRTWKGHGGSGVVVSLSTASVEEARAQLVSRGAPHVGEIKTEEAPFTRGHWRSFRAEDPDGYVLEFVQKVSDGDDK